MASRRSGRKLNHWLFLLVKVRKLCRDLELLASGCSVAVMVLGVLWESLRDHKNRTSLLIISTVLAGVFVWGIYAYEPREHNQSNREEATLRARSDQTQQGISRFGERYNAVTDWRKALQGKTLSDTIYSAEVAPIFVRTDGRPVLFIASLRDVVNDGDHYTIYLDGRINLHSEFRLVLKGTSDQAKLFDVISQG